MTEKELREKVAKLIAKTFRGLSGEYYGKDDAWSAEIALALRSANLLATPEMIEAAEACKAVASWFNASPDNNAVNGRVLNAGRALLAAEKPRGPWRVGHLNPHEARNSETGAVIQFYKRYELANVPDPAACAAFVVRENERLSKERQDG